MAQAPTGFIGLESLLRAYLTARELVVEAGFGPEIDWQDSKRLDRVDESSFLREAAWVILSSGIAEAVVRRVFDQVSQAFLHWTSANAIVVERRRCICRALTVFSHRGKVEAIAAVAERVDASGFEEFRGQLARSGPDLLLELDYLGPATSRHLAKNIGMDVVKADRHLIRAARAAGCRSPDELCSLIAEATGDRIATVDVVFWRYGTITRDFASLFDACSDAEEADREDATLPLSSHSFSMPATIYIRAVGELYKAL